MNICYYVTAHGYGHGVRSCAVCREFSDDLMLHFRTALPATFFTEELKRPFSLTPLSLDCGCMQTDGVSVNIPLTLQTYRECAERNAQLLTQEVRWCHENNIHGIVSDIVPFAFDIAKAAGVRSCAITNFTWYDIYRDYVGDHGWFTPYLEQIRAQYAQADLLLAMHPSLPMDYFPQRKNIAVVGRKGQPSREQLCATLGLNPAKHLGLLYTGIFGMDSVDWKGLERFGDWEFLGLYELPGSPANFRLIQKGVFAYEDVCASVDCVISKIGYGTYAESLLNGVPLLYLPRTDFAEYPTLEQAVRHWGGGYELSVADYYALRWDGALEAVQHRPRPVPIQSDGPGSAARLIEQLFRSP